MWKVVGTIRSYKCIGCRVVTVSPWNIYSADLGFFLDIAHNAIELAEDATDLMVPIRVAVNGCPAVLAAAPGQRLRNGTERMCFHVLSNSP